ncbi:hypothetical protein FFI89_028090 [Bradyrhizobium sp. KBS0727]|uniref:hypothetical protein n=1 Tax=unclassified Bradyrhizobium TaxID=2631580 RepID=UPI00110D4D2B|nr:MULTISPECIES: hypothetical protein [unclassified Bradyrhizobium]QDW40650.1 hypothetical protein FFI71_028095 [Bradyrhizobium sp. KBS0725]QDW47255.1 hypothetical protein FFI89_028090 [Bradyrhizobium sp. KBS0727]
MDHQAADAGKNYDKTFEAGYGAALWQRIEKPLLESYLRSLGWRDGSPRILSSCRESDRPEGAVSQPPGARR